MTRRVLLAVAAVLALGAGCATPAQPALQAAPSSAQPQRIVPLNGDIAEIVWALGLGDQVVGVDTSAVYPPEALAMQPKIGYQRQLAAEGILSLKPTIVIGTPEAGPPEVIEQVKQAGVQVEILPVPAGVEEVPDRIRKVAAELGVAAKGEQLATQADHDIDAAKAAVAGSVGGKRVAFLYVRGQSTALISGKNTRAAAMLAAAGVTDAGVQAGIDGYKPITPEALAAAQPDVLLLLDAGLKSVGGIDGLLKLPGVAQTPAGAGRKVVTLEDSLLLNLGPRTGAALKELIAKVSG
jgi:iron complex transport system substrate-binding protein